MKYNTLIVVFIFLSLVENLNAQDNNLNGNSFISMPDATTYSNRTFIEFNESKIIIRDLETEHEKVNSYSIINDSLILNGKANWGMIKYYDNYFELIDKNNSTFQYTKIVPTEIECTNVELQNIIESSYWKIDLGKTIEKIHITNKNKLKYKLIKINDTFILVLDDLWNYPISKITKDAIELYGLAKEDKLPEKLDLVRENF